MLLIYFIFITAVIVIECRLFNLQSLGTKSSATFVSLRLATFHKHSEPVIDYYKAKCASIVATSTPDAIFEEVKKALDSIK